MRFGLLTKDFRTLNKGLLALTLIGLFFWGNALPSSANQLVATTAQAEAAFSYGMEYVSNKVAYKYGGRITVDAYLQALAEGQKPGDVGVDSSAIIRNAYRSIIPELRFWGDQSQSIKYSDVSSSALYQWNTKPLELDEVHRGDLLFFKNDQGTITGVGLVSHIDDHVIHFIVASANAGTVILTNLDMQGTYWQTSFAGFARLRYTLAGM